MRVDAILSADWHIREDQPLCWNKDYFEAQSTSVRYIRDLQIKYRCPVLVAGDIFHKWNPSHALVSWAIDNFPKETYVIYGQHDQPAHNPELISKSALNVLATCEAVKVCRESQLWSVVANSFVYGLSYGDTTEIDINKSNFNALLLHRMTYKKVLPFPGCKDDNGTKLMKELKGFDLILTGDNHKPFTISKGKRLLVNPGSMMRMTAGQIKFKPRVYLWNRRTNSVIPSFIPQEKDAIHRDYIEKKKEHEERISAFVSKMANDRSEIGLSFESNLKKFISTEKISKRVQKIIWSILDEC